MFEVTFGKIESEKWGHRFQACGIDYETGERILKIGTRDGETTTPFDVFLYMDGRRKIPFIFGDQMDFGECGEHGKIPLASVYVAGIGADLRLQKNHTFHDYILYDPYWFGDDAPHGYEFGSSDELSEVGAKIRSFMRPWLFWQLEPQASKSSHAHMVSRVYFPCYVAEALTQDQATPEIKGAKYPDQYFRLLSDYRGPFIEWAGLMHRRELSGRKSPPSGMEKRSPWGGKHVDAIATDCFEMRKRAAAGAARYLTEVEQRRIHSEEELASELEQIEPPYIYEKLTAVLLRCEWVPTQPRILGLDTIALLCSAANLKSLRKFASASDWLSPEHLLAHLATLWTNRVRDRREGMYQSARNGVAGPPSDWFIGR